VTDSLEAFLRKYPMADVVPIKLVTAWLAKLQGELDAARWDVAFEQRSVKQHAMQEEKLSATVKGMARELMELRGSFPAPKHEHFYDKA
jgi:RecA-family ATPase